MRLICPACLVRSATILGELEGYDVFQCQIPDCRYLWRTLVLGHVKMGARPREGEKYRGTWYHDTMCDALGIPTFVDRFDHDKAIGDLRIQKIRALRPGKGLTLLDVGCGAGAFVLAALDAGFNAFGTDLDPAILDWSMDTHGRLAKRLIVSDQPLSSAAGGWDVVVWYDVLEHLADPYASLRQSARVMVSGGLLVIEAPDPCSPESIAQGLVWRHVKPHEHTMILSLKTWSKMLKAAGFRVRESCTPVPEKLAIYAERV